jgi:redox-sensitive bicupin YhaK (pirin superfamily)
MMDQMGEVEYAPGEPKGTSWHPHRGFETVTYIMDGAFQHQDSHGGGGFITDGATQWMTAGGGILHIETPRSSWCAAAARPRPPAVGQPAVQGQDEPTRPTRTSRATTSRCFASPTPARCLRLIAGDLPTGDGGVVRGPGSTRTPITMLHASITPGSQLSQPWKPEFKRARLRPVRRRHRRRGAAFGQGAPDPHRQTAVLGDGDRITIAADDVQEGASRGARGARARGERSASRSRSTGRSS